MMEWQACLLERLGRKDERRVSRISRSKLVRNQTAANAGLPKSLSCMLGGGSSAP